MRVPRYRLVRTFDLAPPSGHLALGTRFPGMKPWAEFRSPCAAQNKGLSPRFVVNSLFSEQNHPKPYVRAILVSPSFTGHFRFTLSWLETGSVH
jgi:hypothetical protein